VFGESMFTRVPDASKIALAALVAWCRAAQVPMIDCQQNTRHLASLGAREIARATLCGKWRTGAVPAALAVRARILGRTPAAHPPA
jgi:leucyl/phenylalanyl-tRNA--protein transferase